MKLEAHRSLRFPNMATQPLTELIQFRAPRGFSKAIDVVADCTFEPRAALIRRAILQLLEQQGVSLGEMGLRAVDLELPR